MLRRTCHRGARSGRQRQRRALWAASILAGLLAGRVTARDSESDSATTTTQSGTVAVGGAGLDDWNAGLPQVRQALTYLASRQDPSGAVGSSYPVAVTSLAGLATLGAGHGPSDGRWGAFLLRCVDYLVKAEAGASGYIRESKNESRMHGHCYAVLFLSQIVGSLHPKEEEEVAGLIRRAVIVIERAQSSEGGWYYEPENSKDEDEASVTVCALQALRSAHNAGFSVDAHRIAEAVRYVERCQTADGSFCYTLKERGRTSFALTVAALSTLNAAGVYRSAKLQPGLDAVRRELGARERNPWAVGGDEHPFYANLYAAQTLYQDGGPLWDSWHRKVRAHLFSRQAPNGSWDSTYGSEYATACALLILEVPVGYLPFFQR